MIDLEKRREALDMHFKQGMGYREIAEKIEVSQGTIKIWCHRYREKYGIPLSAKKIDIEITKESIHDRPKKSDAPEDRIARLEMEVDLLRNFLILTEKR